MFPSKTLFSLVLIALSAVDASPLSRRSGKATLSFSTTIKERGTLNIAEMDRARAQAMRQASRIGKRASSVSITNSQVHYTAQVAIGSPATNYELLIDTGSSNTWVGAQTSNPYTSTGTSSDTGNTVSVSYGSGAFSGEEWIDQVELSPGLVISQQSIGVASTSTGLNGVDGILGVGPVDLTQGTVANTGTVPTVMDNLFSEGTISQEVLGIYFVPANEVLSDLLGDGTLTFGGYDETAVIGAVEYVPLTTTSPASTYWGIDQSISYGGTTILSSTAGIVDTGTTLLLLATDTFNAYQSATGGVMDSATGLLTITSDQYNNLKPLSFQIGSTSYDLSPNGQIWPRSLNTAIGGSSSSIYLIAADIGTKSGSGLDFINGYTFLERFYSVYDTTNSQVGFATTLYTDSMTN